MNMIFILNVLNKFSLFIILGNLLCTLLGVSLVKGIYYPWICAFALAIYFLKKRRSPIHLLLSVLSFAPVIRINSINEGLILVAVFGYCIYYVYTYTEEIDFNLVLGTFRQEYRVMAIAVPISLMAWGADKVNQFAAPYILINLITYTVLLRIVRFLEHNREDKRIQRINMFYGAGAMLFTLVISINRVREGLWSILKLGFETLSLAFFQSISWVIYLLSGSIQAIIDKIAKLIGNKNLNINPQGSPVDKNQITIEKDTVLDYIINNQLVQFTFKLILILLVTYIVYRIIKRKSQRPRELEGFIEEKEFIRRENIKNSDGGFRRLINAIRPKSEEEKIRYYYSRLLKLFINRKIEIRESDTSLEVNNKGEKAVDKKILDEIREIYILIRYGEHKGDKASSKRISDLVKRSEKSAQK